MDGNYIRNNKRVTQNNGTIEMVPYSFAKDFILVCSLGLNIGFFVGIVLL